MTHTFGPYTPVRRAGDLYFVSGQVGVDPETRTAPRDIAKQTHQALKNLKNSVEGAGLTLDDIIKTTLFLTNMDDFAAVNEIYMGYFAEPRPARSTVAVRGLPRLAGATPILFEIEAVASLSAGQPQDRDK
jgi:2-iminobutanoate/2-iminopropanoate deaminase